jgi:hypothetical protein
MDLEIRFWTVSPVQPGLRISDMGLILVNQLITKIYKGKWIARALLLCFVAMVFTVAQVYFQKLYSTLNIFIPDEIFNNDQ